MTRLFCDDCEAPLDDAKKAIVISEIVFHEPPNQPRGQRGLHFCDVDCLRSWSVKAANRPNIIQP